MPPQNNSNRLTLNLGVLIALTGLATFSWFTLSPIVRMQVRMENFESQIAEIKILANKVNSLENRFELFRESVGKDIDQLKQETGKMTLKVDSMMDGVIEINKGILGLTAKFENYQVSMDAEIQRLRDAK